MTSQSLQPEVTVTKPLFPLPLVLFPGGRLPLQIFEARYLDMVGKCMREGDNFVVTMSRAEGFADLGCEVSIRDFDQLSNGFKLRSTGANSNASETYIYCAWAEAPSIDLFGGGANAR